MEMRLQPPTEYYDEQLRTVDETIVRAIADRQRLSNGRPGFPRIAYLKQWAEQYEIPVSILHQAFSVLFHWHIMHERVKPERFERFVSVMAATQQGNLLVWVPHLRQYNNCSIVSVQLEGPQLGSGPTRVDLAIKGSECLRNGGGGSLGYWHQDFIVTPRIPDDQAGSLDMTINIRSEGGMPRPRTEEPEPLPPTTIRLRGGERAN